jgi:hypothetical protein
LLLSAATLTAYPTAAYPTAAYPTAAETLRRFLLLSVMGLHG